MILTVGEPMVAARLPLRTELLFPPLLQDTAESDLEGVPLLAALALMVAEALPSEVPPLMTVVKPGVGGGVCSLPYPLAPDIDIERLPNLPPSAAVIGTCSSALPTPSWALSISA